MAISAEQSNVLLREANRLGEANDGAALSLLKIARNLGLEVRLVGALHQSERQAGLLDYTSPPRVTIRRTARLAFTKQLTVLDESLLRPRDRFTLAHEIGHWVAYQKFGIGPAASTSEYWQDEAAVNQFAGSLLVPDRQVDSWLSTLSDNQGIHIQQMTRWARETGISREVVSLRLCQRRRGIGFLALKVKPGRQQYFPDLLVSHSASDPALCLPARRRIIRNERLAKRLSEATSDGEKFPHFAFDSGRKHVATYYVSWVRVENASNAQLPPGAVYWTAWSKSGFARGAEDNSINPLF